ncbi:hypothetical protein [Streptomyces olivaceiscleroticus]|uniref:Uncharacterized protein n=1 Tax=Streptomyces olivaceiscleroticus TaxID=68245 RepID=A0ABN1BMF1_9ACTN
MAQPTVRTLHGYPYPTATFTQIQALHQRITELEIQLAQTKAENHELERALGIGDTD